MTSPQKSENVADVTDNKTKDELQNTSTDTGSNHQDVNAGELSSGESVFFQNRSEAADLSSSSWDDLADFFNDSRSNAPGERTSILQTAFLLDDPAETEDSQKSETDSQKSKTEDSREQNSGKESQSETITEALNLQRHNAFDDFNEWDLFDSGDTIATLPCVQPQTPEMKKLLESSNQASSVSRKSGTNPGFPAISDASNLPTNSASKDTTERDKEPTAPASPSTEEQSVTKETKEPEKPKAQNDTKGQTQNDSKGQTESPKETPNEEVVVHHFEGTNEVYVKSGMFDKLCSSPAKLANLPARPQTSAAEETHSDPVVHHFEGTNEIFIQSSVFDALCDDSDKKESTQTPEHKIQVKNPKGSLKISIPKLAPVKSTPSDKSNVFGIVSSGFLPSVDIDKSFDSPCLDESILSTPDKKPSSDAVFASRLSKQNVSKSDKSIVTREGVSTKDVSVASSCGLPNLSSGHKQSFNNPRKDQSQAAIEQFDEAQFLNISNKDLKEIGIKNDVDNLFEECEDIFSLSTPKTIFITGGEDADRSRVIRAFLNKNNQSLPIFTCYTAASKCYSYDIVTALLSSRIGCTPDTPEQERVSIINKFCDKAFDKQDMRWGRDILYIRYGLSRFITVQKNVQMLTVRSDTDALEVLLYLIEHDARDGLVTIAISDFWLNCGQIWRDVIKHLSALKCGDILILIDAPNHIKAFKDASVLSISPYSKSDILEILETVLAEYNIPTEKLEEIAGRITPNFHGIRRALRVIQGAVQTGQDVNVQNFDQAFIQSLGNNERQFLGAASLLTPVFNIEDLIRVMMLQPMKDEIVWFEDKRREWCLGLAQKLVTENELIALDRPGYYRVNEKSFIAELMLRNKLSVSRYLQKAYVSVLISRNAESVEIAKASDNAGLLEKSAKYWMEPLRRQINNFSRQSADILVHYCMKLVNPDNPELYREVTLLCLEHLFENGNYQEVISCAELLARTGYMVNDDKYSIEAFLWQGRAMTQTGQYEMAQKRLLYALQLSEKHENKELISDANFCLAVLLFESGGKGALANALRYAERSLDIRRKLGNLEKIAESQTICADIYQLRGEPQRAEIAANEAYQALSVAGYWYKTPYCLCIMARAAYSLGKPLPLDNTERGFEIVAKTSNPAHKFQLLETRIQLTMNTLQRQQVRNDLEEMGNLIKSYPYLPWITRYLLHHAEFDFSRKNFKKTIKSLNQFFDYAAKLKNYYLTSLGYVLSAELNFEVSKRNLSQISQEKTIKLYNNSTKNFESLGAWHILADTLRKEADFLDYINEPAKAEESRTRADKVDPYCQ